MPYFPPRMFSNGNERPHNTVVKENAHAGESVYKFEVTCSCQWQVLARTEQEAEGYKLSHLAFHGGPHEEASEPASVFHPLGSGNAWATTENKAPKEAPKP